MLYPFKPHGPKGGILQSPDALQRSHQHGSAKNSASHENGLNGFHSAKRPRSYAEEGSSRQQAPFAAANKRQRTAPMEGDIKLSPTQKQYFTVQRHFDAEGHVVQWTVADCTIDDSRDFQQLKHAQAFVDECWAFISVELRASKAHKGASAATADQQLVQQAPATQASQDRRQSSSSGGYHGKLQAAAAAADQAMLSPSAPSCSDFQAPSPCISPQSQAAYEGLERQKLTSSRRSQSQTSDVHLPGEADAQHAGTMSDQAEIPISSSSVSPRWPCKSRQMANVTALHGGLNQQATKHAAPSRAELADFAVRSSSTSQGQSTTKQASAMDTPDTRHSVPVHLNANCSQLNGLMQHGTIGSRPAHKAMDAVPRYDVSMPHLPGLSKSQTPGATSSDRPIKTEQADPQLPSTSIHPILPLQPLGMPKVSPYSPTGPSGSTHADQEGACLNPGMHPDQQPPPLARVRSPSVTISQADVGMPPSARRCRQSSQVSNAEPSCSADAQQHKQSSPELKAAIIPLACVPISWGIRKPRTRRQARPSDACTTDLATVAAAAAAEAEQAAASAVAKARAEFDEAAGQSGAVAEPPARNQRITTGVHTHGAAPDRTLPPLLSHLPAAGQSAAGGWLRHQQHSPSGQVLPSQHQYDSCPGQILPAQHWDDSPPSQIPSARPGSSGIKGAHRTGRNHHRTGASPSNLTKSIGYIGSRYLGVNGVRHSPDFPLRWRAGTWDPLVKKTVYIGSYDTEVGAAAAVDAWHVSQGREAVNFPETSLVQPADSADTHSDSDAVAAADESPKQSDHLSHAEEPAQLHPSPAKDHLHHAASLLNSLRPQAHSGSAQVSNSVRRSHFSAHHGHGGSKSQRQSAAGALVAQAAGRSKASRDGTHQGRHAFCRPQPVPNQSHCTGVSYADGKWRAQIRVDNVVQYLGHL